jgi:hypothetical protein
MDHAGGHLMSPILKIAFLITNPLQRDLSALNPLASSHLAQPPRIQLSYPQDFFLRDMRMMGSPNTGMVFVLAVANWQNSRFRQTSSVNFG